MCFETLWNAKFNLILFPLFSSYWKIPNLGTFIQLWKHCIFDWKKNSTFFIFVSFFKLKNEEGLLNTMYDIMTEEESFLKCLCKSIIEFLICNFSWKWPCSNKSSQITEYQTHGASCLFLILPKINKSKQINLCF